MVKIQIDLTKDQSKALGILKAVSDLASKEDAVKLLIDRYAKGVRDRYNGNKQQ